MLQNKWRHGPTRFDIPDFGPVLNQFDGLMPFYLVLDPDIGREVVLILRDRTDFMNRLKATKPFRLFVKTGLVEPSMDHLVSCFSGFRTRRIQKIM